MQFVPNEQLTVALAPICTRQAAANSVVICVTTPRTSHRPQSR